MSARAINGQRLYAALAALGELGAYTDERTGLVGVNRLALTAADGEGRRHVVAAMRAAGLTVTIDRIGNVYARRPGRDDGARPVMIGSHIDSVATAGRFDGCLGVLGGLEVLRTLDEAGLTTRRPLVVGFFTEEEGARFGTDMLGSAVATGRIALEDAWAIRDGAGLSVHDELERIGFIGDADPVLPAPHAYVECHIEQGPTLRAAGLELGVVTGVQGICWHALEILGKSAHAGTTPMALRADAGVAAARINVLLRDMVASGSYGADLRATMGVITPYPGLVNVVPGRATVSVDLRTPDDAALERAEADVVRAYAEIAAREHVQITHRRTARTPYVPFDQQVQALIADAASARGLSHQRIISGAGHDAQELSRLCKTAMIFVPGEYDGISHNPRELSTLAQCENGVNVLCDVVQALAEEPGP
ncbi:MAG: M20 family metallo-hydrolase [Deltaproteobacteria bacterium]|nr:M20 family metallo-hydrolase [Deltaproteobacteria bacterium]